MEKRTTKRKKETIYESKTPLKDGEEMPRYDSVLEISEEDAVKLEQQTGVLRIVTFSFKPTAEDLNTFETKEDGKEKKGKFIHVLASFPDGFEFDIYEATRSSERLRLLIKKVNGLIELEENGFGDTVEKMCDGKFDEINIGELIGRAIFGKKGPGKTGGPTRRNFNVEAIFGATGNSEDDADECQCPGCQLRRMLGIKKSDL